MEKRKELLQHLLLAYRSTDDDEPRDTPIWQHWLKTTGELPPDLETLVTNAFLPDLLRYQDRTRVTTRGQWKNRRKEVINILRYYQLGDDLPPPSKTVAREVSSSRDAKLRCTRKWLQLLFGPTTENVLMRAAKYGYDKSRFLFVWLNIEFLIPEGKGPFPALIRAGITPEYEGIGPGGEIAARRGYVTCTFDHTDTERFKEVYTEYDCNQLVWWAYGARRCIDYLYTLDIVDPSKIAVVGHSRGGKMALITAALDERVCASIVSHTGTGSGLIPPWRYVGEKYGAETLESSTRRFPYWNNPRMRFFAGRENKLPFDSHFMIALVAPRPLLITEGDADAVGEPWGAQQAYLAAKEVYKLLGCEGRLNIYFNRGGHKLDEATRELYIDWLDMQFGRKPINFPEKLMYTYTFDKWKDVTGEKINVASFPEKGLDDLLKTDDGEVIRTVDEWQVKKEDIKKRIMWTIGDLPPYQRISEVAITNVRKKDRKLMKAKLPIEGKLVVHLTYPSEKPEKLPAVIYLHAYLDAKGFDWPRDYGWKTSVGERLAKRGFLSVEYDQFGYGTRNHECGIEFYIKHSHQSAIGIMLQDVWKVVDALSTLDMVDKNKIMVAGFSLGGMVGLYSAALDERIKAVASTCGFASMRLDVHGSGTEGLKRYSHLRPTIPRLGFFIGHEKRVPYDYHEVLSLIAPRPVLILAPKLNQDWLFKDVEKCYEEAFRIYRFLNAEDNIQFVAPNDFNPTSAIEQGN